jgi:NADPH2:quinone reductase
MEAKAAGLNQRGREVVIRMGSRKVYCSLVLAAWYERQGPASEVLQVGEMAAPEAGPGEVRVRIALSSVNPGDTKKRSVSLGYGMQFARIVPHSDGSGVIDAVGHDVDPSRIGQRVWVYGAQSYRPFGTAAQLTVVPAEQAVELPGEVSDEIGACLGIPGITAHRTVFGDGPIAGKTIMVQGVLGAVGSIAAQLARWGGATSSARSCTRATSIRSTQPSRTL